MSSGSNRSQPVSGVHKAWNFLLDVLTNPRHTWKFIPLLLAAETVLCALIIRYVPYTEIDWSTYMEQIALYRQGERHYSLITGPTGPVVYPAGYIHIYNWLYELTEAGRNLTAAQMIFAGLYLVTQTVIFAVYTAGGSPPWPLIMLVLSKRLHSIYLLRMFNDCFTVLFIVCSIYCAQLDVRSIETGSIKPNSSSKPSSQPNSWNPDQTIKSPLSLPWFLASWLFYSLAATVKMNALLLAPGMLIYSVLSHGIVWSVVGSAVFLAVEAAVAAPFLTDSAVAREYFRCAFDFSRRFIYYWSVNWQFVPERVFSSADFGTALLAVHVVLLGVFGLRAAVRLGSETGRWSELPKVTQKIFTGRAVAVLTPRDVLWLLAGVNAVGVLCARSLHYQFYSWFYWSVPFLLTAGLPWWAAVAVWATQEVAWNVYPARGWSSALVVAALGIQAALAVIGPTFGPKRGSNSKYGKQL